MICSLRQIGARARVLVIAILVVGGEDDKSLILLKIQFHAPARRDRRSGLVHAPGPSWRLIEGRWPRGLAEGGAKVGREEESPDVTILQDEIDTPIMCAPSNGIVGLQHGAAGIRWRVSSCKTQPRRERRQRDGRQNPTMIRTTTFRQY